MSGEANETLTKFGGPVSVGAADDDLPATTVLANGDYVVANHGSPYTVSVFDPLGDRLAGPVAVSAAAGGVGAGALRIAALTTGGFVTITEDNSLDTTSASSLVAHVFGADGTLQSTFELPTAFVGQNDNAQVPSVTAIAGGGFAVTYTDYDGTRANQQFTAANPVDNGGHSTDTRGRDVYVQSFAPDGSGHFTTTTTNGPVGQVYAAGFFSDGLDQQGTRDDDHALATLTNGKLVLAFNDTVNTPFVNSYFDTWSGTGAISAQILGPNGLASGSKIVVKTDANETGTEQGNGVNYKTIGFLGDATATKAGAGFAVLWDERDAHNVANSPDYQALHLTIFNASGVATTGDIALGLETHAANGTDYTSVSQARAAGLGDGSGVAVVWAQDRLNENHNQLYIATFDLQGHMTNAPQLVVDNVDYGAGGSSNVQAPYDVQTLADGSVLVTVEARGVGGADEGVYTQIFSFATSGTTVQTLADGGQSTVLGAGSNYEYGGGGNDTITAGPGGSTIDGGSGDDLVVAGLGGTKMLSGGLGTDTLSFANAATGVSFSLAQPGVQQATGGAGAITASGFENLVGSAFGDTLTGNAGGNRIDGGAGADSIVGGAGINTLIGGSGADTLVGGAGANTFVVGAAADSPTNAHDVIDAFHFGDTLDLTGTGTTAVSVVTVGAGATDVYFSPNADGSYAGLVEVHGDFAAGDVIAPSATFVQNETLSPFGGPEVVLANTGIDKPPLAVLEGGDTVTAVNGPNGTYLLQVYSSTGVAIGAPTSQTTYDPTSSGGQGNIRLAGLTGGGFVAVTADGSVNHGEGGDIVAHVYSASGALVTQFVVDTSFVGDTPNEGNLSVAATADGGFQVVWYDYDGARGNQQFTTPDSNPASGNSTNTREADALSQAFHVDAAGNWTPATAANVQDNADGFFTNGGEQQSRSSRTENVAALANGDRVIAYHDTQWHAPTNGYFSAWSGTGAAVSQILDANGEPVTGKIAADDSFVSGSDPGSISVSATASGYVVLWDERDFPNSTTYYEGLHARFFDFSGNALTGAVEIGRVQGVDANGATTFANGDNLQGAALADGSGVALVYEQDAKAEGHQQLYIETVDSHGHVISAPQMVTDAVWGSGEYSVATLATGVVQVNYVANVGGAATQMSAQFTLTGGSSGVASATPGITQLGTAGADALVGSAANTELDGLAGNDTLTVGSGNSVLNGGEGVDTAVYAGFAHDYALTLNAGAGTVSGGREGGVDRLTSIENVQFLDGTLTFDLHSTAAQVVRLYDSFLGRAPDVAGFNSYLNYVAAGHSFQDMADNAAASPEFANATANLNDTQYVTYVYEHSLHREPDPGGLQTYVTDLENGTFTRTSLIVQAAESPEHVALTAGVVAQGLWIPNEKVEGLELLYDASVQRQPDAYGIASYSQELAQGTTFRQIANQMASSAEFQGAHGSQSDAAYIDSLYVAEVGRHADPTGLAAYEQQLQSGYSRGDILYETAMSQEHQSHVLAFYDPLLG